MDKAPAYIRYFIFIGVLFIYCVSSAVANVNVRGVSGGQCYGNSCVVYAMRKTHIRENLHLYPYLSLCFNCVRLFIALGDPCKQPNCGVFKARSLTLSLFRCTLVLEMSVSFLISTSINSRFRS